jgi:hypothetical protein
MGGAVSHGEMGCTVGYKDVGVEAGAGELVGSLQEEVQEEGGGTGRRRWDRSRRRRRMGSWSGRKTSGACGLCCPVVR